MARYDCDITPLPAARDWIFRRLTDAIMAEISPTILDRGNGLNSETRQFAVYAIKHGYDVELDEPDSAWWQELRVLLKYKEHIAGSLFDVWAARSAERTRDTHCVSASTIRDWMQNWRHDLTVAQILESQPN